MHSTVAKTPEKSNIIRLVATRSDGEHLEILFRQLQEPMPVGWEAALHWQVEAYDYGSELPPVGICWVLDTSPICPQDQEPYPAFIEYMRVFETHQREGIGTALLEAVRLRWPDVTYSPVTDDGQALLDSLSKSNNSWKLAVNEE